MAIGLHAPRLAAGRARIGSEHVRAGAGVHRQPRAFVEMMPRGLRRIVPVETHACLVLAHVERGRLPRLLDEAAQLRPNGVAEIESVAVDRAEPPKRGAQPERAAVLPDQVPEPFQRAGKPQDRALIEAGRGRDLGERQLRLVGLEGVENAERTLHRIDLVLAHARTLLAFGDARCAARSLCYTEYRSIRRNDG